MVPQRRAAGGQHPIKDFCVFAFLYFCICVFVYLCICVFVYLCICVSARLMVPLQRRLELHWVNTLSIWDLFVFVYLHLCICVIARHMVPPQRSWELHGVNTRFKTFCGEAQKLLCAPRSFSSHFFTQNSSPRCLNWPQFCASERCNVAKSRLWNCQKKVQNLGQNFSHRRKYI